MISEFQFYSFKIDDVSLKVDKSLHTLVMPTVDQANLAFTLAIRKPQFFSENKIYVGGINAQLALKNPDFKKDGGTLPEREFFMVLKMGIAGLFKAQDRMDASLEENLTKHQIPAILLPYLRSAMTSLLANAGFGSIIIPLVNIQNLAKNQLENVDIEVVE